MAEYTYKDIIIDPTSEEAENAIGKICYFSDSPRTMLSEIYCKRPVEGILTNIEDGYFEVDKKGYWDCIIVKKEEPKPDYVPFESAKEFLERYVEIKERAGLGRFNNNLLNCGGIWLKQKEPEAYVMITELWDVGAVIGDNKFIIEEENVLNDTTSWVEIFKEYSFLDGTPCGKEVKE